MRTLKKTLCLVLALVMMLGLCAINAAATDLPDDDKIGNDYREAFELANYLKIITGAEVGGQVVANPQGSMTRVQGCYYIARLLKGNYGAGTSSMFTDVSGQDAAVVEWMVHQGYTAGNGDGTFDPYGTMLGMHFAKWLLTALGYDAEAEGMTGVGDKWEGQVRLLTAKTGLTRGISGYDQNAVLTREQAAQMVLNALEADLVEYAQTTSVNQGGLQVVITGTATSMGTTDKSNDYANNADGRSGNYIQLIEMYYPSMKKVANPSTDDKVSKDDLNTPMAYTWKDNRTEVYRVLAAAEKTYSAKTDAKVIASDLAGYYILSSDGKSEYAVNNTVKYNNGEATKAIIHVNGAYPQALPADKDGFKLSAGQADVTFDNDGKNGNTIAGMIAALTADGRDVEIFATDDDPYKITNIIVTCYTVAKVDSVETKNGTTTYKFKAAGQGNLGTITDTKTYEGAEDQNTLITDDALAKDDVVLLTSNYNDFTTNGAKVYAYLAEKKTGTQNSFTSDAKVRIDGTDYKVAAVATKTVGTYEEGTTLKTDYGVQSRQDNNPFSNNGDVTYYLDASGSLVHVEAAKKAETGDYAFIVAASGTVEEGGLDGNKPIIRVRAVLSDGTWGEYTVKVDKKDYKKDYKKGETELYYPSTDSQYAVTDKSKEISADYWVIRHTDIIVSGGDVDWKSETSTNNAAKLLMSDLYGYVYSYKLDGSEIELTPLGETTGKGNDEKGEPGSNYGEYADTGARLQSKTYTGQTTKAIVKGLQNYTQASWAMQLDNYESVSGTYGAPGMKDKDEEGNTVYCEAGDDRPTVIVGSNTTFITFDTTSGKQKVDVKVGLSNLPSEATKGEGQNATQLSNIGYYVATGAGKKDDEGNVDNGDRLNAKIVFIAMNGAIKAESTGTKEYIFVNTYKAKTTEGEGDKKVVSYQAWDAKGKLGLNDGYVIDKEGKVSGKKGDVADDNATGLYHIDEAGVVTDKVFTIKDANGTYTISDEAPYFYVKSATVGTAPNNGGLQIDSGNVKSGSGNHIWNVPSSYSENTLKDKDLIVILKVTGGNLTTDIETIFVVDK